jgi:hypothetical protein
VHVGGLIPVCRVEEEPVRALLVNRRHLDSVAPTGAFATRCGRRAGGRAAPRAFHLLNLSC